MQGFSSTYPTRTAFCLAAALLSLLVFGPAYADPPVRKVTVIGTATIKVVPDEMHWIVAISINDKTLAQAKARHDASLGDALKFIKSLGNSVKDLQTGGIRIDKNTYAPPNSPAAEKPYSCSTQFTFTLTDFDKYGQIADALSKFDGVQVQSVDYASSKEEATRKTALEQALLNAHDKANDLAVTANCYIDRPLEIVEGTPGNGPQPLMMARMGAPGAAGTPEAIPGQIEISAAVTATYDLYYK
ncbi:MAG: SIMPL domain-containing protein [Methylacidiphilales bacterium]|nr:SIMPL domain-containing protein [Candidatus Methylacidiphilales bacterium]